MAAPDAAAPPRAVVAPAAAAAAAVLLPLRENTPLCLIDMVDEPTSVTRLLMTPLVRTVIGMAASALALFLQVTTAGPCATQKQQPGKLPKYNFCADEIACVLLV